MLKHSSASDRRRTLKKLAASAAFLCALVVVAAAHPLGNFTINHYARIEIVTGHINVRCVIDMAEIPVFQELQQIGDTSPDSAAMKSNAGGMAAKYAEGLELIVDGTRKPLRVTGGNASTPPGAGGLPTLRIE